MRRNFKMSDHGDTKSSYNNARDKLLYSLGVLS